MNLRKVLTWLLVAFLLFYLIQEPESSGSFVRSTGEALGDATSTVGSFLGSLL